nr:MAG TPA: hypothetical protein [Caudoviricetes sp.]
MKADFFIPTKKPQEAQRKVRVTSLGLFLTI